MNRILLIIASLLVGLNITTVHAETADGSTYGAVEEKMRTLMPNAKTIAVSETPIKGILQVQINSDIVYVTEEGQYLLQGQIIDLDTRDNITDQAKSSIRMTLLADLDPEEQISFTPAEPDYELLVFTDLDCGYCRKLHDQMAEYNDQGIAIHYLAFPRAGVGSASYDNYVSVYCADDQQAAMTLAKGGGKPEPKKCANPISDQYNLGREIGVTGTPSMVMLDGTMIPGYVPPAQLRQRLEALAVPAE